MESGANRPSMCWNRWAEKQANGDSHGLIKFVLVVFFSFFEVLRILASYAAKIAKAFCRILKTWFIS